MTPRADAGEAAIRRTLDTLQWRVAQRVTGRMHGDYLGIFPGPGSEAGDTRLYVAGDDIRLIDWNVTARTNQPHVRTLIHDHELNVWLVIDTSASLALGTRGGRKAELALLAAAAFGFAASKLSNPIGAVLTDGAGVEIIPARSGTQHLRAILFRALEQGTSGAVRADPNRGLETALARCAQLATHRGFVAVISDFLVPAGWQTPLHRIAQRHTTVAVEVVDPLDRALPPVGMVTVEDPETGDQLLVNTASRRIRERYAQVTDRHRDEVAADLLKAGVERLQLSTDRDWIGQVVAFVQQQRRHAGYRRTPWRA